MSLFFGVLFGLVLTWTLVSLLAMNIQEWLAGQLKWRARLLEKSLIAMFGDIGLTKQFYSHPLIQALFTGRNRNNPPSYIPAEQFSQALMDILASTGTEASILEQQLHWLYERSRKLPRAWRQVLDWRAPTSRCALCG